MLKQKYETLTELLKEVKATRSLDTNIDFIVHVQDLIGHSTENDLYELSKEYKETFYRVYDEAEGIEASLRFFASYSNFSEKLQNDLADAEADRDKYNELLKMEKEKSLQISKERNEAQAENARINKSICNLEAENEALKNELTALKAKLYDMITA
jgi:chromosome segregation ATPase